MRPIKGLVIKKHGHTIGIRLESGRVIEMHAPGIGLYDAVEVAFDMTHNKPRGIIDEVSYDDEDVVSTQPDAPNIQNIEMGRDIWSYDEVGGVDCYVCVIDPIVCFSDEGL